jgi:hypothetical protein
MPPQSPSASREKREVHNPDHNPSVADPKARCDVFRSFPLAIGRPMGSCMSRPWDLRPGQMAWRNECRRSLAKADDSFRARQNLIIPADPSHSDDTLWVWGWSARQSCACLVMLCCDEWVGTNRLLFLFFKGRCRSSSLGKTEPKPSLCSQNTRSFATPIRVLPCPAMPPQNVHMLGRDTLPSSSSLVGESYLNGYKALDPSRR